MLFINWPNNIWGSHCWSNGNQNIHLLLQENIIYFLIIVDYITSPSTSSLLNENKSYYTLLFAMKRCSANAWKSGVDMWVYVDADCWDVIIRALKTWERIFVGARRNQLTSGLDWWWIIGEQKMEHSVKQNIIDCKNI